MALKVALTRKSPASPVFDLLEKEYSGYDLKMIMLKEVEKCAALIKVTLGTTQF